MRSVLADKCSMETQSSSEFQACSFCEKQHRRDDAVSIVDRDQMTDFCSWYCLIAYATIQAQKDHEDLKKRWRLALAEADNADAYAPYYEAGIL